MLYTLNLYSAVCQLYLNKTRRKNKLKKYYIEYLKADKRVDLKSPLHKKKNFVTTYLTDVNCHHTYCSDFTIYTNIESCCTSETNTMLYINHTSNI